jgi:hypothetical protein
MRKFLIIFCAILVYLVISSKSCGSDEQEEAASKETELALTKQNIKNEFESDELSKKSLKAFEVKAKQELVDFSDYLRICSNKQLDSSFRTQARRMIRDMFITDSVRINGLLIDGQDKKIVPLIELLDFKAAGNITSMDLKFDDIKLTEPLRKTDEFNYKGRLAFSRNVKTFTAFDSSTYSPARMEAEIYASKVFKAFGKDTLQVWSVFLGDIK